MTFRECAIVMAHTGITMLEGENIDVFYKYLAELFNRPVYTHEIASMSAEIKERSRQDFIRLCKESVSERLKDDSISRKEVLDLINESNSDWYEIGWIYDQVNRLPSVMPTITHCEDCIHWKHSNVRKNYCEVFDWNNKANDFCSFAERREYL